MISCAVKNMTMKIGTEMSYIIIIVLVHYLIFYFILLVYFTVLYHQLIVVLSWHLPGGTEENHEKPQSG
jgi:hypothetical protein